MAPTRTLIYLVRRDLRVSDNPILHHVATYTDHGFARLLPVYIFPANQIELSGFIKDGSENPYPEAKSQNGKYWRCGPFRAKFIGQAVWNLQESLKALGSGLVIRVGAVPDVVRSLVKGLQEKDHEVGAVWMTSHEGSEEKRDEDAVAMLCAEKGAEFKLWTDEKYFIDDRDVTPQNIANLPDIFTTYRKSAEPLRERPRAVLPAPTPGSLPVLPDESAIPAQSRPFSIPESLQGLATALVEPVKDFLPNAPPFPEGAVSAHPFRGGEEAARARLGHVIKSGGMKLYRETRNGLIGTEFSTKMSAYLAQGCITSRQIHHALVGYEDGTDGAFEDVDGYGAGENEGTMALRFELLWRDYMRLCHRKYGHKLFRLEGFKGDEATYKDDDKKWKTPIRRLAPADQDPTPERVEHILERFKAGTMGMGLIDASQRELLHTGYTSNRARQNVASFLAKHLGIDWRYGAEWYEMLLVDYDVSSNWANWQYVAGVGNDPRGEIRIFNPIKQALDYDKDGQYTRSWLPELNKLEQLLCLFQACTASEPALAATGLEGNIMVTDPVKKIDFLASGKPPKPGKRPYFRRKGKPSGNRRSGSPTRSETTATGKRADDAESAEATTKGAERSEGVNEDQAGNHADKESQPDSPGSTPVEGSGQGMTEPASRGGRGARRGGSGWGNGSGGNRGNGGSIRGRRGYGWRGGRGGRGARGGWFGGGRGQDSQLMANPQPRAHGQVPLP